MAKTLASRIRTAVMVAIVMGTAVAVSRSPAYAHDLGGTVVEVVVAPDGRLQAAILVDPETLLRRLQLEAGEPEEAPASLEALYSAIRAHADLYVSTVTIEAAATRVPLTFQLEPSDTLPAGEGAPTATVRLAGMLPADATAFTWRYDLPLGSYALRVRQSDQPDWQVQWLMGGRTSDPVRWSGGTRSAWRVVREYLVLGFLHILPRGLDHILFVLSLFLLSRAWRPLLLQVSAFTLAHSVTLALSVVGLARLPGNIVEPLIAASIAWVAAENLFRSSLTRTRLAVVFGFGLLHGFGFAGVLSELGLPTGALVEALAAFNVGVELGQLTVLGTAALVTAWIVRQSPGGYRRWVVVPGSCAIALVGVFWTVQRVLAP